MRQKKKMLFLIYFTILLIMAVICFFTMLYPDNLDNSQSGYNLLNNILSGNFNTFYNEFTWSYGISIYSIYAIWSIPIWLVFHIFHVTGDINDYMVVLLWYKLLLLCFAIWSVVLVGKIAQISNKENKKTIILQYISSPILFFIILYIAQCDIIGLCFALLGIKYYIQRQNKKFILCFAISATMKYFALIVFIPLVLLKEKNIFKIITEWAGGISLVVLTKFCTMFSTAVREASSNADFYVNRHKSWFTDFSIQISDNTILSLFGIAFCLICGMAYYWKCKNEEVISRYALWISLSGYMCFCLLYPSNIYWNIVLVPFMVLVGFFNTEHIKLNVTLELLFSISCMISFAYGQDWVFMGEGMFSYLSFKDWGIFVTENAVQHFFSQMPTITMEENLPIVRGVEYACAIMFLLINVPDKIGQSRPLQEQEKEVDFLIGLNGAWIFLLVCIAVWNLTISVKESRFENEAQIIFDSETYTEEKCHLEAEDLYYTDQGVWMKEQLNIRLILDEDDIGDIELSTYGYTLGSNDEVEVYVNSQLVGVLQKEDEAANTTERSCVIQKEYFDLEQNIQTISLKAIPVLIGENEQEHEVSLCMYDIKLKKYYGK